MTWRYPRMQMRFSFVSQRNNDNLTIDEVGNWTEIKNYRITKAKNNGRRRFFFCQFRINFRRVEFLFVDARWQRSSMQTNLLPLSLRHILNLEIRSVRGMSGGEGGEDVGKAIESFRRI